MEHLCKVSKFHDTLFHLHLQHLGHSLQSLLEKDTHRFILAIQSELGGRRGPIQIVEIPGNKPKGYREWYLASNPATTLLSS
jgi:hypothetical protein